MVNVGQTIAVLDEEGSAGTEGSAKAVDGAKPESAAARNRPAEPPARDEAYDALHDAASTRSEGAMRGGRAHIRFPPRKTESGLTISSMPAMDQEKYIARGVAAQGGGKGRNGAASGEGGSVAAQPSAEPSTRAPSQHMRKQVPRSEMSEAEMEAVMLGGAM